MNLQVKKKCFKLEIDKYLDKTTALIIKKVGTLFSVKHINVTFYSPYKKLCYQNLS